MNLIYALMRSSSIGSEQLFCIFFDVLKSEAKNGRAVKVAAKFPALICAYRHIKHACGAGLRDAKPFAPCFQFLRDVCHFTGALF